MKRIFKNLCMGIMLFVLCSSLSVNAVGFDTDSFYTPGDVYGSEIVDINDVTYLQKYLTSMVTKINEASADFNVDGKININDATEIQKMLAGMNYKSPVKKNDNYIKGESGNLAENSTLLEAELLYEDRWGPFSQNRVYPEETTGMVLVTSKEELFSATGKYSPDYGDEFFKDNAMLIYFCSISGFEHSYEIKAISISDNTLYADLSYSFIGDDPNKLSPIEARWNIIYSIKKSYIQGVERLVYY